MKWYRSRKHSVVWGFNSADLNGFHKFDSDCIEDWYFNENDIKNDLPVNWGYLTHWFVRVRNIPDIDFFSVRKRDVDEIL